MGDPQHLVANSLLLLFLQFQDLAVLLPISRQGNLMMFPWSVLCMDEDDNFYPKKTLSSFVSEKSYLLFNLLKIEDLSWLAAPVALWSCVPSYALARDFVKQLLTINDGAERGMRLMQELIDRTEDEEDLQHLTQCVSHNRKLIGNTKKDYEKLCDI